MSYRSSGTATLPTGFLGLLILMLVALMTAPAAARSNPDDAQCLGLEATILGTDGNDVIEGTAGDDVIVGFKGNDVINGLEGNDTICGKEGDDVLSGGPGADSFMGGQGDDHVFGDDGDDDLSFTEAPGPGDP